MKVKDSRTFDCGALARLFSRICLCNYIEFYNTSREISCIKKNNKIHKKSNIFKNT